MVHCFDLQFVCLCNCLFICVLDQLGLTPRSITPIVQGSSPLSPYNRLKDPAPHDEKKRFQCLGLMCSIEIVAVIVMTIRLPSPYSQYDSSPFDCREIWPRNKIQNLILISNNHLNCVKHNTSVADDLTDLAILWYQLYELPRIKSWCQM